MKKLLCSAFLVVILALVSAHSAQASTNPYGSRDNPYIIHASGELTDLFCVRWKGAGVSPTGVPYVVNWCDIDKSMEGLQSGMYARVSYGSLFEEFHVDSLDRPHRSIHMTVVSE